MELATGQPWILLDILALLWSSQHQLTIPTLQMLLLVEVLCPHGSGHRVHNLHELHS